MIFVLINTTILTTKLLTLLVVFLVTHSFLTKCTCANVQMCKCYVVKYLPCVVLSIFGEDDLFSYHKCQQYHTTNITTYRRKSKENINSNTK